MRRTSVFAVAVLLAGACVDQQPMEPAVATSVTAASVQDLTADTHIFVFAEKTIPADFAARVAAEGGTVVKDFKGMGISAVAGLSADGAAALGAAADVKSWNENIELTLDAPVGIPDVEAMVDDVIASPANPTTAAFFPRQWHLRQIGADVAWAAGKLGSPGVKVGILDTGIDYRHADLVGRVDLSLSRSFVPGDDAIVQSMFPGAHPIADLHYHGTHVAATVSSNAVAAAGVTSQVTLVGIKVLNYQGSGNTLNTLSAIEYAADIGLDVINMSLGVQSPLSLATLGWLNDMMNAAMEYSFRKGVVVVVSAGNEIIDLDNLGDNFKMYCTANTLTCVSATGPTSQAGTNGPWTNPDALASYSNFGVTHISVAAPGGNGSSRVTAACSGFSVQVPVCRTGTFVLGINGTSMASPHVAATAALLVEKIGKRQPGLVRQRLQQTSDDLGKKGADPSYGKGRINVKKALGL